MSDLEKLFLRSKDLQKRAFGSEWAVDEQSLDAALQHYAMNIVVEAVELLQETNYRRHRVKHPLDIEAAREEAIDVLLYALAASTQAFNTFEQFRAALIAKMDKNDVRKDWMINNGEHASFAKSAEDAGSL